ncbi:AMP-binding enzyme family protein [Aspergillus niger]|nr:AMP-binding enzyme family protein [Aspergillus niger]
MPVPERAPLHRIYHYGLLSLLFLHTSTAAGRSSNEQRATANPGYTYGQAVPVTCLNRTIDSGEHITDPLGNLQYIPFPTCNETSQPLSLHYGVAEQTLTCTIASLPDELYHLLEYYVHSDVPMTCRVPTAPLLSSSSPDIDIIDTIDASGEQAYTPITFAIQGTLQLSHLHIWTDMNVLVHNMASTEKKKRKDPGYVVAGTAYSVPEFDNRGAREPWTEGHGTKVVRGEPLTFRFSVKWVEGGRGIGWPSSDG